MSIKQWKKKPVWPFFGCYSADSQTDAGIHQLYNNGSLGVFPLLDEYESRCLKGLTVDTALFQIIPRGNVTQITALYAEYINGKDPIPNQHRVLREIEWLKTVNVVYNRSLSSYAHQSCSDLIFAIKYQEIKSDNTTTLLQN